MRKDGAWRRDAGGREGRPYSQTKTRRNQFSRTTGSGLSAEAASGPSGTLAMMMNKKWKVIIAVVASVFVILFAVAFCLSKGNPYARRNWKHAAIARISEHTENPEWIAKEIAELAAVPHGDRPWKSWLSKDLIVMANGEWMAYSSICRKQDFWICDIFIGRGSDRKWYYSTYHFCIGMCAMLMDYDMPERPQPESIAAFAERHALKEFDGKSDVCLQKTWPPTNRSRKTSQQLPPK